MLIAEEMSRRVGRPNHGFNFGLDRLNPVKAAKGDWVVKAMFLDSSAALGATAPTNYGLGSLVGVGAPHETTLVTIKGTWTVAALGNGRMVAASGTLVGLDAFNVVEFGEVLAFIMKLVPFADLMIHLGRVSESDWNNELLEGSTGAFNGG